MYSRVEVRTYILLLVVSLGNKGINNRSMLQDEEVNLVPITVLYVIFIEVLEEVRNRKNKFIGKDVGIEE